MSSIVEDGREIEVPVNAPVPGHPESGPGAAETRALENELRRAQFAIEELNQIGVALSAERDTAKLLELILTKLREITGSDAGSLYLVEESESGEAGLRFKLVQNESLPVRLAEFVMPIDDRSIAGYVALTGRCVELEDAYHIPPGLPFRLNLKFDEETGYRTKSMLVLPMKNPQGEVLGVIQLINCKHDPRARVTKDSAAVVGPYPEGLVRLATSLVSQAAVALENNRLYENIQALFEGFVGASVGAIEARDPSTSGHSFRVAEMTVALARAVDRTDCGAYRDLHFSVEELRELRYASLLHDFGKVGVREEVLVKAKKLYPWQLALIRERFAYVRRTFQEEHQRRGLEYVLECGREEYQRRRPEFDEELTRRLAELDRVWRLVIESNEPTVLPEDNFQNLVDAAEVYYADLDGEPQPLITTDELRLLCIPKGTLDDRERRLIEAHVLHTYNFLSRIPWPKGMRNLPLIASAHHERLDGTGYPFKLSAPEIPVQAKLMAITDFYDALAASDRPYKPALPPEQALDIIRQSAGQAQVDQALFDIFVESEVWRLLPRGGA